MMDSGKRDAVFPVIVSEDEMRDADQDSGHKGNLKSGDMDATMGNGDDDDDGLAQDYSKFAALVGSDGGTTSSQHDRSPKPATQTKQISAQTIRRGEKDFEAYGTHAQSAALESSRNALEAVLSYTRVHGVGGSDILRGWYFPDAWMDEEEEEGEGSEGKAEGPSRNPQPRRRFAHTRHRVVMVEAERGPMFASVGAVPGRKRASWVPGLPKEEQPPPAPGCDRVWLLPEEALFLVERGSMDLRWPLRSLEEIAGRADSQAKQQAEEDGIPLSLQAAYALLIDSKSSDANGPQQRGRVSLPFFQVYSHLRRSGYQVLRAAGLNAGSTKHSAAIIPARPTSLWQWLISLLAPAALVSVPLKLPLPYGPLVRPGLYHSYGDIYGQMQLFPASLMTGAPAPPPVPSAIQSPFHIDFHVWKSSTTSAFSKARPPPPDFFLAVADAHASVVPTLEEIDGLLASVQVAEKESQQATGLATNAVGASAGGLGQVYRRLKQGHGGVIIAIVDHGLVNYMRFGNGPFGAEPLWTRFDGLIACRGTARERRGGKGGGGQKGKGKGKGNTKGRANNKKPQGKGKLT
ncbi:tRNA splicing endonuclease subunit [Grosmannia clavigera kw1407]|uniref:tRNA splicing endonuclease subunit n=1 Tax=Grosmannia clavigera (strain kw1407 / UAMH 11150) TaxID=655863 RepID=F0XRR3_GROCL|nr:tRNA splicing endonuclease subunit [Grosmannia clavigera kw1407]EFW99496.1 tRNA splicing endonuclease subunit [Grosmannia clavigera kw1407]